MRAFTRNCGCRVTPRPHTTRSRNLFPDSSPAFNTATNSKTVFKPTTTGGTSHSRQASSAIMSREEYKTWSKQRLIEEIKLLKREVRNRTDAPPRSNTLDLGGGDHEAGDTPKKKKTKPDPSKYSTRYIALKLAYLGKNYSGFEYSTAASLPSIETEIWKALVTACLIFPEDENKVDFTCCDYSKCGRTDRGVSAFGQVIGLRVRSNRPLPKEPLPSSGDATSDASVTAETAIGELSEVEVSREESKIENTDLDGETKLEEKPPKPFDEIYDEIQYARVLNRILPKDIRILAWCPSPPPDFSARFSCRERQYRYFFTNPGFPPEPAIMENDESKRMGIKPGWLDIEAMKTAASYYLGEHDFRNVCKIDPTKQLTNYTRIIYESTIEEVEDISSAIPYLKDPLFASKRDQSSITTTTQGEDNEVYPKVYCFKVRGSAFLYHQIRNMVSLLFLVGQGWEKPTLIQEILDVESNPRRPQYNMADEVPLVLWDCVFPGEGGEGQLDWRYVGSEATTHKYGNVGVMNVLWETWREKKMDEILANRLLDMVSSQGDVREMRLEQQTRSAKVYEGGTSGRLTGHYRPVMTRPTLETPDEINQRYAKRSGFEGSEEMKAAGGFAARREKKAAKRAAAAAAATTTPEG